MYVLAHPLLALTNIFSGLLFLLMLVVLASAVLSWVNADPRNPIVRIIHQITLPLFARVRPYVPIVGGLDLSPMLVLILIVFVKDGILPIIQQFALSLL